METMLEILDRFFGTVIDLGASPFVTSLASFLIILTISVAIKVVVDVVEFHRLVRLAAKKVAPEKPYRRLARIVESDCAARALLELKRRW